MPADSGRGNEEGSGAQARRLSEPLLWLWVAAILYLGSSFSIHPQGLCGTACRPTRPYPLVLRASAMVVSGKGPQVAPGPLQTVRFMGAAGEKAQQPGETVLYLPAPLLRSTRP